MGIVTAVVLGGIAAAATVKSMVDQRKAAKQQERANKQAQRQEAYRSQRERLQAVRQQRIANASAINQGAVSGLQGSSMIAGGISAFNSQTASNMQFTNQMDAMTMERMRTLASADKLLNRANMFGQVASLAGQGFSAAGGFKTIAASMKKGATT